MLNTLCVFGTRPEAIKMAPVIKQLEASKHIANKICVTGQHQQMLKAVLSAFEIQADFDLNVMMENQDLSYLTAKILTEINQVFKQFSPDLVLVHGDTTTTLAATLSAYYHQIPVAHVEAGLRTGNIYTPWPEEANRKLTGSLASIHFAPTELAKLNLLNEGCNPETIFITGNTVIDALQQVAHKIDNDPVLLQQLENQFPFLSPHRKMILITGHRRENFGLGFKRICTAIAQAAVINPHVDFVYPVHLNPNVQNPVKSLLKNITNIHLINPVDYLPFVYLMKSSTLILTDSGGIQEEAPSLGKPVLVMRDCTERPEAIEANTVKLVGTDIQQIVSNIQELLTNEALYQHMSQAKNPYGDGKAAIRIVETLLQQYVKHKTLESVPLD